MSALAGASGLGRQPAGGAPAGGHFLLLAQEKVTAVSRAKCNTSGPWEVQSCSGREIAWALKRRTVALQRLRGRCRAAALAAFAWSPRCCTSSLNPPTKEKCLQLLEPGSSTSSHGYDHRVAPRNDGAVACALASPASEVRVSTSVSERAGVSHRSVEL